MTRWTVLFDRRPAAQVDVGADDVTAALRSRPATHAVVDVTSVVGVVVVET